ncbi:MBL fold metallo-hydrolase [Vagococcus intermedius]|uniref:MBL fold metallo-hydrolase n=1 Tax=Vagococcus intermedius TaxID=2991418 RepID=A0AAF0I5E4_9ENTE|nr:MBL fold metallo-hydrolase [Vagococcus intermedius]WEG72928.1 MBL fold metallo-hydrolase [Vagococcus intermedius]WEG75015.1 MBL fold metallo-hydrolase [Vagococcus intermedius]
MIHVTSFVTTGSAEENCYLIYNEENLLVVDPGNDSAKIQAYITKLKRNPVAILLTHTHYDHIGAVEAIRQAYDIPVYVSPLEQAWLGDPMLNLSGMLRHADMDDIIVAPAEYEFEMREYTLGGMTFTVVPTPGHSIGSVSLIFHSDNFVITGDALFAGNIGRTDLHTGNMTQLLNSVQTNLFTLPDDYTIYPGHRGSSTIGHEKATNPFFN